MSEFAPAMPHGELREIFPDVFFVTGTSRPDFEGTRWQYSRNMTVVREGGNLTLLNTVRLDDEGLKKLDQLGSVAHIVRLGAMHGMDDAFYRQRYGAKQWALPGMEHQGGHATDHELVAGGPMPVSDGSIFQFQTVKLIEGLFHLDREGGILIACDSLQNWAEADEWFDEPSKELMQQYGFIQPTNVGPGWRRYADPKPEDFTRVKALTFRHLLPAHGTPVLNGAYEQYAATFAREFNV